MAVKRRKKNHVPTEFHTDSVYDLSLQDGEIVAATHTVAFDPAEYSRFKYGDGSAATHYASVVADELVKHHGDSLSDVYIASSAQKHVPTAANALSRRLVGELVFRGHQPAGVFRIDRAIVRTGDYSAMTEEARRACTQNNGLVLPEVAADELVGKTALIIDDIKVTGSHEKALHSVLGDIGIKTAIFGYVATVDPETAQNHPEIEYMINHAYVKNLDDLAQLTHFPHFSLNARTCKFILSSSEEEIRQFAQNVPEHVARDIVASMVADGYHKFEDYTQNFQALVDEFSQQTRPQLHVVASEEQLRTQPNFQVASNQ